MSSLKKTAPIGRRICSAASPRISGSDPAVSAQSATLGDPIPAATHRYYMVYYRDPIVLGACPASSTFNGTQALDVIWNP